MSRQSHTHFQCIFFRFQTIPVIGTWLSCSVLKIQVASPDHIIAKKQKRNNRSNDLKYFPRQFGASGKTRPGRDGGRVMLTVRKVFLFKIRDRLTNQMKTMIFYSLSIIIQYNFSCRSTYKGKYASCFHE